MSRFVETLAAVDVFKPLDGASIQRLDTQCIWRRVEPKHWIVGYDDSDGGVLFIVSGAARVQLRALPGRDVYLRQIANGDFFGELSDGDSGCGQIGVVTVTEVTYARMTTCTFRRVLRDYPDVTERVLHVLADQMRSLLIRVREFASLNSRHRVCAELLRLSRPVAGRPHQALVSPPLAHAELAARIGVRRESVSRELKRLERAGFINKRVGALVLTDTARLRDMLQAAYEVD